MKRYHKIVVFFAYLSGLIAFLAVIVDDRENKLFSFHIWQAFFLNLILGVLSMSIYGFWLPNYIKGVAIDLREAFFAQIMVYPLVIMTVVLLILGIVAARGVKFQIPLLAGLADKIVN